MNWTQVLVYGVPAWIAAVFAGLASLRAVRNGKQLRTRNGSTIGEMVERTHELAVEAEAASHPDGQPERP